MNQRDGWESLLAEIEGQGRHDPHDQLIRQIVRLRARDSCEYCLHPTLGQFQIDHIIPYAHWKESMTGQTRPDHLSNFAWSCPFCNTAKSKQVSQEVNKRSTRLFNPRLDRWLDHFTFMHRSLFIVGTTPIGIATQIALGFNEGGIGGPLGTRHESILVGRYPPAWLVQREQS